MHSSRLMCFWSCHESFMYHSFVYIIGQILVLGTFKSFRLCWVHVHNFLWIMKPLDSFQLWFLIIAKWYDILCRWRNLKMLHLESEGRIFFQKSDLLTSNLERKYIKLTPFNSSSEDDSSMSIDVCSAAEVFLRDILFVFRSLALILRMVCS